MRVCLDTNAYSRFMRNGAGLRRCLEEAAQIYVPAIVLGELYAGFSLGSRYAENCSDLEAFLELPGVQVTAPDKDIAERYGYLVRDLRRLGKPIPTNDLWIAATALETGARLVSYDAYFEYVPGLMVIAP
ncbi:MAG: PIN domain-containing protein [Candidatus Latescibacteria bacterium]|nr:PIN domain-containing protein [Candidatus Latescibacterota bacterium]